MAVRRLLPDNVAEILRKIGRRLLFRTKNGDLPVFLLFLLIAFLFWLSQNMSGNYEMDLRYEMELVGTGGGLRITKPVTPTLHVSVSGKGSAIWNEKRKKRVIRLNAADFTPSSANSYVLASSAVRDSLEKVVPSSMTIRSVYPDSIRFSAASDVPVRLPVAFGGTLSCDGRFVVDSVTLFPDSVNAGMPASDTARITGLFTEPVEIKVNADTVQKTVQVVPAGDMILYASEVNVKVVASQVTEKSLNVPVVEMGFPDGVTLKTFPPSVRVSFSVRLDDFEKVTSDDFTVAVDYASLKSSDDRTEPEVLKFPEGVYNVRISPQLVEYLLEDSRMQK